MNRFIILILIVALASCATYDGYGYGNHGYYADRYYNGSSRVSYGEPSSYYVYRNRDYDPYPDYVIWSDYYSVLWPVYRRYYDPFYTPRFFYGVTFYPHSYFGLHRRWQAWPYYHAYSPYRYSYYDGYYDRWDHYRRHHNRHHHDNNRRPAYLYGSERNEAERLANQPNNNRRYQRYAQPGARLDPGDAQRGRLPGREPEREELDRRRDQPRRNTPTTHQERRQHDPATAPSDRRNVIDRSSSRDSRDNIDSQRLPRQTSSVPQPANGPSFSRDRALETRGESVRRSDRGGRNESPERLESQTDQHQRRIEEHPSRTPQNGFERSRSNRSSEQVIMNTERTQRQYERPTPRAEVPSRSTETRAQRVQPDQPSNRRSENDQSRQDE